MAMAYALIGSLVEAIFPQDRTKAYQPATVLSQDEDGYELVLYDGFETTCSAEDVRPYPLEADTQLLALVPGLPVDLHDPKTGRWRTMCSLQSADMPLREGMEILLLDPGNLNAQPYPNPRLRLGLDYVPDAADGPWQLRLVPPECQMIVDKAIQAAAASATGDPWPFKGVHKNSVSNIAETEARGKDVMYRARTQVKRKDTSYAVTIVKSIHQAAAARAYDLYLGKQSNRTDPEWKLIKEYLQLADEKEPRMVPGNPAAAAGSNPGKAPISPAKAGTPSVGAAAAAVLGQGPACGAGGIPGEVGGGPLAVKHGIPRKEDASLDFGPFFAHLRSSQQQQASGAKQHKQQQQQQCLTAARSLHPVSRSEQAKARATLRRLRLDRCYAGQYSLHGQGAPIKIPWAIFGATPGVSSWQVHAAQLPWLGLGLAKGPGAAAAAAAAAGRLKELKVVSVPQQGAEHCVPCLSRLLAACTGLEELDLQAQYDYEQMEALYHDMLHNTGPAGTAAGGGGGGMHSAAGAAAGSRSAAARGPGLEVLNPAISQQRLRVLRMQLLYDEQLLSLVQQHLGPRLETLALSGRVSMAALGSSLSHCSRLRSLDLEHPSAGFGPKGTPMQLPEGLAALTSLTFLGLHHYGFFKVPEAVVGLLGLRSLDLSKNNLAMLQQLSGLSQLSALDITNNTTLRTMGLPPDLGARLPALQALTLDTEVMEKPLPTDLSTVTRLEVVHQRPLMFLHEGAWEGLHSLQHCNLSYMAINTPQCLALRTGLQVLVLRRCVIRGVFAAFQQLAALPHLTHLDLHGAVDEFVIPADMVQGGPLPSGACAHLTHLNLSGCDRWLPVAQLPLLGVLTGLQQLLLADISISDLEHLGPWLVQQPALAYLDLSKNPLLTAHQLQPLPTQLEVLILEGDYDGVSLQHLPLSLVQLTGISELHLSSNKDLQQLPEWLSCLRRLELLDLRDTGVKTQQHVLAALPALRRVRLSGGEPLRAAVFAGAKHLHFAEQVAW